MDYMYKYSLTWKFPEQVNIMSGIYVLRRDTIRYIMVISYFVDISKRYFPNLCVLAKRFSLVRFMGSSPWGLHSLVKG